uniref:Tll0287-like domain-containing protein n=2 Tax=environmental samples TaxID=48479 RepID=C7FPD4_9BACT|nr:hypothetical protein [uncultured bacterium HF186_25m_30B18]ACU26437.1 hypothetical protein [uncultured bacterium HF186_75m_14K15]
MIRRALMLSSLVLVTGCEKPAPPGEQAQADVHAAEVAALVSAPIPGGTVISPTLVIGGQPTKAALEELATQGLKHVINLRTPSELDFDEEKVVKELKMSYQMIPVPGAKGLTESAIDDLHAALNPEVPTLVHCASGNRVGALFALRAQRHLDADFGEALATGVAHGLKGLKGAVSERLHASPKDNFPERASARVTRFKEALSRELGAAIKAEGLAGAIDVCAQRAPALSRELSTETLSLRRVGTRVRNSETNTPSEAMRKVLKGLSKGASVYVGTVDDTQAAVHGLFIDKPLCLSCHGPQDTLAKPVLEALKARYPDDEATGYAMGDLRGAIVVERRRAP